MIHLRTLLFCGLITATTLTMAQQNPGPPGGGRPGGGPGAPRNRALVKQFDKDKDGMLSDQERLEARRYVQETRRRVEEDEVVVEVLRVP